MLCVHDKMNKCSFEPVCVWILCLNGLGCLVVSDEDADVSDVFWIDCWYNCEVRNLMMCRGDVFN